MGIKHVVDQLRSEERYAAARVLEDTAAALQTDVISDGVLHVLAIRCAHAEQREHSLMATLEGINASLKEFNSGT